MTRVCHAMAPTKKMLHTAEIATCSALDTDESLKSATMSLINHTYSVTMLAM